MAAPGSLNRAAQLLDALVAAPDGRASIARLADLTGVPRPTLYRVANRLLQLGWIERTAAGDFAIGARLALLAHDSLPDRLTRVAATELAVLARRLGHTLYLDVRDGLDLICLGRFEGSSRREVSYGTKRMRMPFGATPATMAMLARLPDAVARDIIAANTHRYNAVAGFDLQGFLKSYERSRRSKGALFEAIILDRRMCGLGVAICDASQRPIAGIGLAFARGDLTRAMRQDRLDDLAAAAAHIQSRLWQPRAGGATSPRYRRRAP